MAVFYQYRRSAGQRLVDILRGVARLTWRQGKDWWRLNLLWSTVIVRGFRDSGLEIDIHSHVGVSLFANISSRVKSFRLMVGGVAFGVDSGYPGDAYLFDRRTVQVERRGDWYFYRMRVVGV